MNFFLVVRAGNTRAPSSYIKALIERGKITGHGQNSLFWET